jgi:hypothetical protein
MYIDVLGQVVRIPDVPNRLASSRRSKPPAGPIMDHESPVSADLVLFALSAPRSRPPPARPRRATRAGPPPVGQVRSTPERTVEERVFLQSIEEEKLTSPLIRNIGKQVTNDFF